MCFEAADSPMLPSNRAVQYCNTALSEEALSRHDTVATHVNRGILRLRRGQVEAAIADFDTAIEMDPNQPESYLNKGAALIRQNNAADARQLFSIALERNTTRPAIAHFGRAIANEELGNVREAYHDYRRASELDPTYSRAHLQRSTLFAWLGRRDEAIASARRSQASRMASPAMNSRPSRVRPSCSITSLSP